MMCYPHPTPPLAWSGRQELLFLPAPPPQALPEEVQSDSLERGLRSKGWLVRKLTVQRVETRPSSHPTTPRIASSFWEQPRPTTRRGQAGLLLRTTGSAPVRSGLDSVFPVSAAPVSALCLLCTATLFPSEGSSCSGTDSLSQRTRPCLGNS